MTPVFADLPSARAPLDYRAYDSWKIIRGTTISEDGKSAAYTVAPEDGDPVLVIHRFGGEPDVRAARGIEPHFTPDGAFVAYTILPPKAEIDAAKKAKKKPEEQPKNGLGIIELATGKTVRFDRVKSVKIARHSSRALAFLFEPRTPRAASAATSPPASTPSPTPSPTAAPLPTPYLETPAPSPNAGGISSAALPVPTATPTPNDLKKKDDGTELAIRLLPTGAQLRVPNVTDYAFSPDGRYIAYATQTKDSRGDGIFVLDLDETPSPGSLGPIHRLLTGEGHYTKLTFAPEISRLAFLSDRVSFASNAPHYDLYDVDLTANPATEPRRAVDTSTGGLPAGYAPSINGELAYSKDGQRLFLGTAPAPTAQPSGAPEPLKVDVWNWRDDELQSVQRHDADKSRKKTFRGVFHTQAAAFVQLASTTMPNIAINENVAYGLGVDDRPYRKLKSWEADYADLYAVALRDGSRRLIRRKAELDDNPIAAGPFMTLSPDGGFIVDYDAEARGWYAIRTSDGLKRALTSKLAVPFYDERDDHPGPPVPHGFGGWSEDGRQALFYDRYDVWAIDPQTGAAATLTAGVGRRRHIVFRTIPLDPERNGLPYDQPLVLSAFNDETKDGGLFVTSLRGSPPRQIVMLAKRITGLIRAKSAARIVLTEQRFDEAPNLWSAPGLDGPLAQFSDANPQIGAYRWGHAHLIAYRSQRGTPLQGAVYIPEGLPRDGKAPLLVYIYERRSDDLHRFIAPAPGTSPNLTRYASNGYVVLQPDIAYRVGHPGSSALECVLPAIDAVLKEGYVDPKRVGIAGHSWGAYQITYMVTRTDRFRAAEAGAAVSNMTSAYGGIRLESGRVRSFIYERSQSRIGATPWDRPDLYLENSALFHVKDIHTPYLTIHDDLDGAVPWQQGVEFFTAMRRLGKEAYMFEYDGEDHNLRDRENQKHWTVHLDQFFDHFLKGAATPAWMTAGTDFLRRGEASVRPLYGEEE